MSPSINQDCPCCSSTRSREDDDVTKFLTNGDVINKLAEIREEAPRTPLKHLLCGGTDVKQMAGRKCREEGGCCSLGQACLEFHTTAPFYKTNLLFLVSGAKFRSLVEDLVKKSRENQKNAASNSPASVKKRKSFTDMLSLPAKVIVLQGLQEKLKSCPLRSQSKVERDMEFINDWFGKQATFSTVVSQDELFFAAANSRAEEKQSTAGDEDSVEGEEQNTGGEEQNTGADEENGEGVEENTCGEASIDSDAENEERKAQSRQRRMDLKRRKEEGVVANVPIDLLRRLGPVFSKYNISHAAASEIIASVYNECAIPINQVTLSENSSKRLRSQDNGQIGEEVLQKFGEEVREKNVAETVHFDTKFMKQRIDGKRSEKDRLVVTITGDKLEKSQLLQALVQVLPEWGGEEYPVKEPTAPCRNFASSDTYWRGNGLVMPPLSTFVSPDSFLIFRLV